MNPFLAPALPSINTSLADYFNKPLSRHRFDSLIGDIQSPTSTSVATTPVVTPVATVDPAPTVVASATTATSDSVPTLVPTFIHPNPVPYLIDTGASYPIAPASTSDFAIAPFGLICSAKVASKAYSSKRYSTPVDPNTSITGEDIIFDLSSPDPFDLVSDLVALGTIEFSEFGTATLTLIYTSNSELIQILVEPTQVDWIHWVPLPRLTPTESYFHLLGFDYTEVFALLHLYPLWIAVLYVLVSSLFALVRSKYASNPLEYFCLQVWIQK